MLFLIQTNSYQELHDQTAHNLDISMTAVSLIFPSTPHMVVVRVIIRIWKS